MTTGAFWDVSNPMKPVGLFDRHAQLDIPFDWSAWLTDKGASYSSHTIEVDASLTCVSSNHSAGVISALIKVTTPADVAVGTKLAVTCKLVATLGAMTLKDDRTVYLKVVER